MPFQNPHFADPEYTTNVDTSLISLRTPFLIQTPLSHRHFFHTDTSLLQTLSNMENRHLNPERKFINKCNLVIKDTTEITVPKWVNFKFSNLNHFCYKDENLSIFLSFLSQSQSVTMQNQSNHKVIFNTQLKPAQCFFSDRNNKRKVLSNQHQSLLHPAARIKMDYSKSQSTCQMLNHMTKTSQSRPITLLFLVMPLGSTTTGLGIDE